LARTGPLVPPESVRAAYSVAQQFHALPDAAKHKVHQDESEHGRGWCPAGEEPAYEAGTVSVSESFDVNGDEPNQWPEDLPVLRATVQGLYSHLNEAAECLLLAFAECLHLKDRAAFSRCVTGEGRGLMRLMRYLPPSDSSSTEVAVGIAVLTRFNCCLCPNS